MESPSSMFKAYARDYALEAFEVRLDHLLYILQ